MKILIFVLFSQFSILVASDDGFADYYNYEEAEEAIEEIICSSDAECPQNQPKCLDNHCQPECFSNADCQGKTCQNGKCVTKKIVTKERITLKARSGKHGNPGNDDQEFSARDFAKFEDEYVSTETDEFIEYDYPDTDNVTLVNGVTSVPDIPDVIDPDEESYEDEIYEDEEHKNKTLLDEYDDVVDKKTPSKF